MKKTLIALGLSLGATAGIAHANTGSINFHGQVTAGTCSIEIIDPSTGLPLSRVFMGNVPASKFEAIGTEFGSRAFSMRVTPGTNCDTTGKKGVVTFTGAYGAAGAGGDLHALEPGSTDGLALAIKDITGALIANGSDSKDYDLDETDPTDMQFSAHYRSTAASVAPGPANTDLAYVFTLK
ncbi:MULTISPECIES: fimbrial protein [Pseudomonas]|jgi:major type 1 subunit fimbrin (pilin)|uniref:Type 1 fimbrial protein n=1 Tax=Pseudomonas mosselii TaxID=78327 RepID=A0A5R8Z5P1_9PSED|nr:fimbrial protein [Pseudomonas mosselii]TLP61069.1 type 1 fimbrial protein [Pseudomonas mosselii]